MNQPIPDVTERDVVRIVQRDFPNKQFDDVISILNEYGTEGFHRSVSRVRIAVLKLADGDLQALRREINAAKRDYRDVLAYAEYPEYMHKVSPSSKIAEKERERILRSDWMQYLNWLDRK